MELCYVLVLIQGNLVQRPSGSVGLQPAPVAGWSAACWFAVLFSHDGTAQGEGYCSASGEILRPLQEQLQRRRSARACSSIKNESVGSEDDQTPS